MNFTRICTATLITAAISTSAAFAAPIDIQRHWSAVPVNTLLENHILTSFTDGRFRPDHFITREDTAVFCAALIEQLTAAQDEAQKQESQDAGESDSSSEEMTDEKTGAPSEAPPLSGAETYFSDIDSDRASEKAIALLTGENIITGYPDGTFRPQAHLSREEFAVILHKLYSACKPNADSADLGDQPPALTDIETSFASEQIQKLCAEKILSGDTNGTFRPKDPVTRAEAASALYALSGLDPQPPEVELPDKLVIEVPYISQIVPYYAIVGCEGTSLLMGLQSKGYAKDLNLKQFLDAMPKHPSNPAKGFVGSPYRADPTKRTRTTILPAKLAEYGQAYGTVADISYSSPKEIQAELLAGNPVVIYATLSWEAPFYRTYDIEGQQQRMLSNNHVVLACGYDSATGAYYISDPYNNSDTSQIYKYWIDKTTFEWIYNARRHAVVIR